MKSMNLKRIATAGLGAALLASACAAAVTVDEAGLANFKFFNNAEPNVKIAVGSIAQPSDAVAAANIAAMVGNLAYTSSDITVLGMDALSCEGGGASGTTKVTATVTTPGVNSAVAYQMKTYVEGYLDYDTIDDRGDYWSTAGQILPSSTSSTLYAGRKVTSYETPLAYKGTISDTQAAKTYTEEEKYYFYAQSTYDSTAKAIKSKLGRIGYEAIFTDAIPTCTNATPSIYVGAACPDQYRSEKHRIKIKFLGADWVLYEMNGFATDGTATANTQVVLGKEVQYKEFMQIGDEATAPNGIKVVLKDISGMPYGTSYVPAASFDIYDASGNKIDTTTLQEIGTTEYNKNNIVVKIWKAFVGTGGSAYAQVSIFSDKLTLTNTAEVNIDNRPWTVAIWEGGSTFGASLARIQVKDISSVPVLASGEYINVMKTPASMRLTYTGLETATTKDIVSMTFLTPQYLPSTATDSTTKANVVMLSSTRSNAFQFSGGDASDKVYLAIGSATNAKVGQMYYYKNGYYTAYNGTGYSSVNVTVPTTTAVTLASGSNWSLNNSGLALGVNNCTNMSNTVTAFSGTTNAAGGTTNGTNNLINAAGTSVILYNEAGVFYSLATLASVTNATGTYTCNGTVTIQTSAGGGVEANGTITGFTVSQFFKNFVTYSYGPNTVTAGFDASALSAGACSSTVPDLATYVIHIPEYTTDSDTASYAFKVDMGGTGTTAPCFVPTAGLAYIGYGEAPNTMSAGLASARTNNTATNYETGFIGRRGGKATVSTSTASIDYPSTLSHALYTFGAASLNATANSASDDYAEGASILDTGGYKVVLDKIKCGAVAGANMTGADGLACSSDKAYVVEALDTSTTPLVVTDTSGLASGTEALILVGGPLVNTLTAQVPGFATMAAGDSVVKIVGDKVVVAGYTAADTTAAANSLIAWLSSNTDTLVR